MALLEAGGRVVQETRSFDEERGTTASMRDKEKLADYRLLREPNLPPLRLYMTRAERRRQSPQDCQSRVCVEDILEPLLQADLPEARRQRLHEQYQLGYGLSEKVLATPGLFEFFEAALKTRPGRAPFPLYYHVGTSLLSLMERRLGSVEVGQVPFSPRRFGDWVDLMAGAEDLGALPGVTAERAQQLLELLWQQPDLEPLAMARERDWLIVREPARLLAACQEVLDGCSAKALLDYRRAGASRRERLLERLFVAQARRRHNDSLDVTSLTDVMRSELQKRC